MRSPAAGWQGGAGGAGRTARGAAAAGGLLALLSVGAAPKAPPSPPPVALVDVAVVDVRGGRVEPHRTVILRDGRIASIDAAGQNPIPDGTEFVDGRGRFLVPGLWDMHVHTGDPSYFRLQVASGVTGVRDMGGAAAGANDGCESVRTKDLLAWRAAAREGTSIGPRVVLAGPAVSGTGAPGSLPARTPKEAARAVKDLEGLEVDFVRVDEGIPPEAYDALIAAARGQGLPVAGLPPVGNAGLLRAVRARQRSVEHVREPLLVCFAAGRDEILRFFREDGWSPAEMERGLSLHDDCPAAIEALRGGETWLTPTLVVEHGRVAVDDPRYLKDPRRAMLPASVRQGFAAYTARRRSQPEAGRRTERLRWEAQQAAVRRLHAAGARFLAGTDAPCEGGLPGFSLHEELELLVGAGLTPLEALQAATLNAAAAAGMGDALGAVEAGKRADLVLLEANPIEDISRTRRIDAVVVDGRLLRRSALDALIESVVPPEEPKSKGQ